MALCLLSTPQQVPSAWQAVSLVWKSISICICLERRFGLHTKTSTSIIVEIRQSRLGKVYCFDRECIDAVMNLIGTTAVTQGPQRTTVSSVVMEDERRILRFLHDINDLLNHFNPSLTTKFSILPRICIQLEVTWDSKHVISELNAS